MRRIAALVTVTVVATLLLSNLAFSSGHRVLVSGSEVQTSAYMTGGQLVGLVAPVADRIGAGYRYDTASRTVTLQYDGTTLSFTMGSQVGKQNGRSVWLPVTPHLGNGQPMAPLWWLAKSLGTAVAYSTQTGTLTITPQFPRGRTAPPQAGHPLYNASYVFPYPAGVSYSFKGDTWSDPRGYQGQASTHEGNDILAAKGAPIVAVASGTIVKYGWNTLGGYRLTIRLDDNPDYHLYYAHFDRYAPNIWQGKWVRKGELLGYTGQTGQGPERTEGTFPTHLHFGIYGPGFKAINPYYFLRFWELNRVPALSALTGTAW